MAELPSDINFNIFSRLPIKSLARFRCVSKLWRECIDSRHLAIIHGERSTEQPTLLMHSRYPNPLPIVSFNITKSKEGATLLEANTNLFLDSECHQSLNEFPVSMIRGSCHGLIYLSLNKKVHNSEQLVVIHPIRKECYELPPMNPQPYSQNRLESYGLGFDASTNTFKMVCIVSIVEGRENAVMKNECTMVHVLRTESWRMIPQVPVYPIYGDGVFAHGCLHWLSEKVFHIPDSLPREVTCFDVKTEEFRLISPPKETRTGGIIQDLVDLLGEVGYVYHYYSHHSMEVWILKEKKWVMHYHFDQMPPLRNRWYVKVLGRWNKDGDLLIRTYGRLFVYNLKRGLLDEVKYVNQGNQDGKCFFLYPANNLSSIRGISTNAENFTGPRQPC